MNNKQSVTTLVTLANGAELVTNIAQGIIGNNVADTFNGSPLTRNIVFSLAMTKFQASLAPYLKGN